MLNEAPSYLPEPKKARVEIIPLIDVVFFLLATFVLFTLSLDKTRLLVAQLPTGDTTGSNLDLSIQASGPGMYYWKLGDLPSEQVGVGELRTRLAEYSRTNASPRVFIRGDNQARLGSAVQLLDEVRLAGIKQVAVETVVTRTGN